jgi:hypothetical protein
VKPPWTNSTLFYKIKDKNAHQDFSSGGHQWKGVGREINEVGVHGGLLDKGILVRGKKAKDSGTEA